MELSVLSDCLFLNKVLDSARYYRLHCIKRPPAKNDAAALRQEAFRADRHFSNASNFV